VTEHDILRIAARLLELQPSVAPHGA
jgi:hypothetical protein